MEHKCDLNEEMGAVLKDKRAQSGLFSNLWFHDVSNRMRIRRQAEAKVMGLGDDYPVGTYPSHGGIIINDSGGFWKGALIAGLASAGIGAGVMGFLVPEPQKKTDSVYEIEILGTEDGVKVNNVTEVTDGT